MVLQEETRRRAGARNIALGIFIIALLAVSLRASCGGEEEELFTAMSGLVGAPKSVSSAENSAEIEDIGKYAVDQHNAKEGKNLSFSKVISAKEQVVQGTMYHLKIEALDENKPKLFDAKVWHKPWENHKSLEHFKHSDSKHEVAPGESGSELDNVSIEDPAVKQAAEHALKNLQNMSNSLAPYKLLQIVSARAKASDELTQFQLHLKVGRGTKEEDVKADLHRSAEGTWVVKHSTII